MRPATALVIAATLLAARPALAQAPADPPPSGEPAIAGTAPASDPAVPIALPAVDHPARHRARALEWSMEAGLGVGSAMLPVALTNGDRDSMNAGGGVRFAIGVRTLRLAGGLLETRASLGFTGGPIEKSLDLPVPTTWISLDAQATEHLRLGAASLGAGWFQRLGVNTRGDGTVPERWSGRPGWVAELSRVWDQGPLVGSFGIRFTHERLVARSGVSLDVTVTGVCFSLAGGLSEIADAGPGPTLP